MFSVSVPELDLYRTFQPLAIMVWYFYLAVVGWSAFPLLYVTLPKLPDRAYGMSRLFGMLFTAWLAWLLASLGILHWSGLSVVISLLFLAGLSLVAIHKRGGEFLQWVRAHRSHLLLIEFIIAGLFVFFLLVRLGNPDLWHPYFGGEKPMDFSYFNAVLKSLTFPPYDPWFAGGTINYYYFGFVIVGSPVKVLGIPPALAYNLIIPTLFTVTGTMAFSSAYNLLAGTHKEITSYEAEVTANSNKRPTLWQLLRDWPQIDPADVLRVFYDPTSKDPNRQAVLAGWAALFLVTVLGNLDQIRTFVWGLAELGSGTPAWTFSYLPPLNDTLQGLSKLMAGQILPVGTNEWYWNATRVIPAPGNQLEITEFPYFTFLYADLHAHMIALPITLAAITWCIGQIRTPGRSEDESFTHWQAAANIAVGSLIIGSLRAVNTWDWPTYSALAMITLTMSYLAYHKKRSLLPASVIGAAGAVVTTTTFILLASSQNAVPSPLDRGVLLPGLAVGGIIFGVGCAGALLLFRRYGKGPELSSISSLPFLSSSSQQSLFKLLFQNALFIGLSILFFLPFIQSYHANYTSAALWTLSQTPIWAYLDILGLPLFIVVSWLIWESWIWWQMVRLTPSQLRRCLLVGAGAFILAITGIIRFSHQYPAALVSLPVILWALLLFLRPNQSLERRFVLGMLVLALTLTQVVEQFVLVGDIGRMNTVFKFYFQIWVLMGIVAGAALGWLRPAWTTVRSSIRFAWLGVLFLLVALAGAYSISATQAKMADRWNLDVPLTLDGMAFMPYVEQHYEHGAAFSLEPDYEALRWLQENIEDTPVVLEGLSEREYLWGNRVAVYTGLPSVVGWRWHQTQQRGLQAPEVETRRLEVAEAYSTTDITRKMEIFRRYNVELIIVGNLERAYYPAAGLQAFESMRESGLLRLVYEREGTSIYRLLP